MVLNWQTDEATANWTRQLLISPKLEIAPQFGGNYLWPDIWQKYILAPAFPEFCYSTDETVFCSPENIIRCFREGLMLEGLALTMRWGNMVRTQKRIHTRDKAVMDQTLRQCADSIAETRSIEDAWKLLVRELFWTDVMASKCLHFLARSLGYSQNPGVAIDNAVILREFAPLYDAQILQLGRNPAELGNWRDLSSPDASWQAYNRYMTAVLTWTEMMSWTTTEVEATIFNDPAAFFQN